MSEYTPKTWEIKHSYVDTTEYVQRMEKGDSRSLAEINEEFDRWLAQHDAEVESSGGEAERERIIGLVETRLDDCHDKNDMGGWSFMPELFIALIKEETNE